MRAMVCALLVVLSGPASAALISRLSGQAIYDSAINVTWLADANLGGTNSFGVAGISAGNEGSGPAGRMHEQTAIDWLAAMNAADYLGASDWRNANGSGPERDCFPVVVVQPACRDSELGHMYFDILGAEPPHFAPDDPLGTVITSDERGDHPPFKNIQAAYLYSIESGDPHSYSFISGYHDSFGGAVWVWAVRDGDIGAVPEPRGSWLLGAVLVAGIVSGATRFRRAGHGRRPGRSRPVLCRFLTGYSRPMPSTLTR